MGRIKNKIFYKMILSSVLILLCVVIIIFSFNYSMNTSLLKDHAIQGNFKDLELIAEKLDKYIENINLVTSFAYESDVQNLLRRQEDEDYISQMWRLRNFQDFYFKRLVSLNFEGEIQDIYFIYPDGEVLHKGEGIYLNSYDFTEQDWFLAAAKSVPSLLILDTHEQPYNQPPRYEELDGHEKFVSIVKSIGGANNPHLMGIIMMDINVDRFSDMIGPLLLGQESKVYFANAEGKILFSDNQEEIDGNLPERVIETMHDAPLDKGTIEDKDYVTTYMKSRSTGWYLVNMNPTALIISDVMVLQRNILLVSILALVSTALFSVIFARRIFRPVEALTLAVKEVEKGRLDLQVPVASQDEIGVLTKSFNRMLRQIRELIHDNYVIRLKEKDAVIESLELQINPHFLYNTLESINCIAKVKEIEEISVISNALANMFRYSTNNSGQMVTVNEEVTHIKNYINIQKIRFGNMFRIDYDVADEVTDCQMIPLVLQPLVENSIKYNIEKAGRNLYIRISIQYAKDEIQFSVQDDGVGFTAERLKEIREKLYSKEDYRQIGKKMHIGLQNVHGRLRLHYGEQYGLWIDSIENRQTCIFFSIPVKI